MSHETPRFQESGTAEPILPEERAADEGRREAEHDPTATTGDELGAPGIDENAAPDHSGATADPRLPPSFGEEEDWEEQDQPE